jgi:hypothetical protein
MFQRYVANCRLTEYILKCTPVIQTPVHLGHDFIGDVHSKTAALDPAVKDMAKVLFTFSASFAVLSNASGAAKTQRSQSSWPKTGTLFLKPIGDMCRKFFFGRMAYMCHIAHIQSSKIFQQLLMQ